MADKNVQIVISAKDKTSQAFKSVQSGLSSVIGEASSISTAFGGVAIAIGAVASAGVKMSADFEQTATAFRTILGDGEKAGAMLEQLSQFAAQTPFEFPEIANAGKSLLAFGFSAGEVKTVLGQVGDVASSLNIPLGELSEIYGKIRTQGQVFAEDINQLTGRGIPIIAELAKQFGVAESEVKKLVENGRVGFPEIQKAFQAMTSEGGRFAGGMLNQSKTLSGLFSTLKDNMESILRQVIGISNDGTVAVGSIFDSLRNGLAQAVAWIDENKGLIQEIANNLVVGLSQTFTALLDFFKGIFQVAGEAFAGLMEWMGINTSETTNGISKNWSNVFKFIAVGIQVIALGFKNGFAGISLVFKSLLTGLKNTANTVVGMVGMAVGAVLAPIQDVINGTIKALNVVLKAVGKSEIATVSFADKVGKTAVSFIADSWSNAGAEMESNWSGFTSSIEANTGATIGKLDGILASFQSTTASTTKKSAYDFGAVGNAISTVGNSAKDSAKKAKESADEMKKLAEQQLRDEKERYDRIKSMMDASFANLDSSVSKQKSKIEGLKGEYVKLGDQLKKVGEDGAKELAKIDEQLSKQAQKITEIRSGGTTDVAKRVVEAQKELADAQKEQLSAGGRLSAEELTALQAKIDKLKAEIALGQQYAGNKAIQDATNESQKSEVQLLIDKTAQKVADAETERAELQKTRDQKLADIEAEKLALRTQMDEKKALILSEHETYKALLAERKKFDLQYFQLFGQHIAKQIAQTQTAIESMKTLASMGGLPSGQAIAGARANGGPVSAGSTYLVGERGPELFTPSTNGNIVPNGGGNVTLNVTIGNVNANDKAQVDSLIDRIKNELARDIRLARIGIS